MKELSYFFYFIYINTHLLIKMLYKLLIILTLVIIILYILIVESIVINDVLYVSKDCDYVKVINKNFFNVTITRIGEEPTTISIIDFLSKYKEV